MKHKSIRRGRSIKHKRSISKRSSSIKRKRSSSIKRKRSTKKRISRRRLYGGGDVPSLGGSSVTQKGVLNQAQAAGTQQAVQNSGLRGGGIIGTNCNPDYVAQNAAGFCDVGPIAAPQISNLLQAKEYARFDVPKA